MLTNQNIIAFATTTNPEQAQEFYQHVLGLELKESTQFAIVFNANGIDLRIAIVESFQPQPFSVLGWHVDDIKAQINELLTHGVVFERYGFMEQDDLNIWHSPDGAQVAWFKDLDGNLLSLAQYPPAP